MPLDLCCALVGCQPRIRQTKSIQTIDPNTNNNQKTNIQKTKSTNTIRKQKTETQKVQHK